MSKRGDPEAAFVYFIQAGPSALQTGNHELLRILYAEDVCDREYAIQVERDLHAEFEQLRIHREWFRLEGELVYVLGEIEAGVSVTEFTQYVQMRRVQEALPEAGAIH